MNEILDYLKKLDSKVDGLARTSASKDDLKRFATKDDLKNFATKDDLKNDLERFPTKDDLRSDLQNFATKDDLKNDLQNFATKDDLKNDLQNFATKDDLKNDLQNFATKDDLHELFAVMKNSFDDVHKELGEVKTRLTAVELNTENWTSDLRAFREAILGNTKRIDRLEERMEDCESRAS